MRMTYAQSLNHTLDQLLATDENVVLIGQGTTSPWYVGTTTKGLVQKYGPERVIDTPVSENAVTGMATGMAIAGLRPIIMHPRQDFTWLAMDAIANQMANWEYMFGDKINIPVTIWTIINRGGEQAAQHSQALQAVYSHIPGLKVVAPSDPESLKGLFRAAVYDEHPVVVIDDRWLYQLEGEVILLKYLYPIGKARITREGDDITIITGSWTTSQAQKAAERLEQDQISAEIIDLLTYKPLDTETIRKSVKKTGKALIVDAGWKTCGLAAEIAAQIAETTEPETIKIKRLTLPDTPAPAARTLEKRENMARVGRNTTSMETSSNNHHRRDILVPSHLNIRNNLGRTARQTQRMDEKTGGGKRT